YLPQSLGAGPAPIAVYIHGGGWQEGDKTWITRILPAERLVARGYAVAAIDYRLAPRYAWPAPLADVKCAIRFLRGHAERYGLDATHIGVWGDSAGGHLAALLGLVGVEAGLEGSGGYPEQSSAVQAVVTMSAPADFTPLDLTLTNRVLAQMLLGRQPGAALLRQVSPVSYARAAAPPFLIFHGDSDTLVAPAHAHKLYGALRAAGSPATLVMVEHAGHVFAPVGGPPSPSMDTIDNQVLDFFDASLEHRSAFRLFPQTGRTVRGPFLAYWGAHGGVARFGYPVSEALQEPGETDGVARVTQYFQRAVLVWYPDGGPAGAVRPLPLGARRYAALNPAGGGTVAAPEPEGVFRAGWAEQGGLAELGRPLSAELEETSELDGRVYRVQYFEQGVLEYHSELKPPRALLAQLGTLHYRVRYPPSGAP
ncbi:MAG TPA: alpha/beta hydrolase, partial [Chloroflexia bacterium]|nr:alpha/beta hydrolase [Chloroflexia bacterium]